MQEIKVSNMKQHNKSDRINVVKTNNKRNINTYTVF